MIAGDVMTENPRTISTTATIAEAVDVLQSMEIRHLPVVDEGGNLVGMLSDRDLGPLLRVFTEGAEAQRLVLPLSRRRVVEFMSAGILSVNPDTEVSEIIDTMLEQKISALPVVDGEGEIVGIVSYVDVLRALNNPEMAASARAQARVMSVEGR
jgi:acetoin utilization protein AcuB